MPSYDPRRPLARYGRTLLFVAGGVGALLMLTMIYYRPGEQEFIVKAPVTKFPMLRFPSDPPRAIDSPYWATPETPGLSGEYHVFLVENWNRYENAATFPLLPWLASSASFSSLHPVYAPC